MKKTDIKIGEVYKVMIGDEAVSVRLMSKNRFGKWVGLNADGDEIIIKSDKQFCNTHLPKSSYAGKKEPPHRTLPSNVAKPKKERTVAKTGGLSAAVKVLQEAGQPLNCQEMIKRILEKGYWKTEGKTPAATIYSAITREIKEKGEASRFRKTERGKFELVK
jgi:hypothetical protein